jgi:type IV pilus assembly protein PilP
MMNGFFKKGSPGILAICVAALLASCGSKDAGEDSTVRMTPPQRQEAPQAAPGAPVAPVAALAAPETPAVPADAQAKPVNPDAPATVFKIERNPFKSFIVQMKPKEDGRVKGPLECCEIELFRLLAVITGVHEPKALVLAPDGKRYTVKKGDYIGLKSGKITEINKSGLVVTEPVYDAYGNQSSTRKAALTLPSDEERKKLRKK